MKSGHESRKVSGLQSVLVYRLISRLSSRLAYCLSCGLFCGLLGGLISCTSSKKPDEHPSVEVLNSGELRVYGEATRNVQPVRVEDVDLPDTMDVMGRISATEDRTIVVPARVSGRIDSVKIASGEFVKTGQVLATIASPDFITAREEYLQSVQQAKNTANAGTADFSSLVGMSKKRLKMMGMSEGDIEQLSSAKPSNRDLGPGIDPSISMLVRATSNGAVIAKTAIVGNQVNIGDTLFTIADLSKVWFIGDVYPEDLNKIKKGQKVTVSNEPGLPPLRGVISFISPVVDATARTIKVRALIENPKLALRADSYIQGGVVLTERRALVVPTRSVIKDGESNYVFKVVHQEAKENKTVSLTLDRVKVEMGKDMNGKTSVKGAIAAGDEVAGEGALLLNASLTNQENQL